MLNLRDRLLLVGNDSELSSLLLKILKRKGCQVTEVTVETALEVVAEGLYDGALVDWFSDYRLNHDFKVAVMNLARHLPVVLLTEEVSDGDGKSTKRVGEYSLPILSFDSLVRQVLKI